jgi:hypothetical protein
VPFEAFNVPKVPFRAWQQRNLSAVNAVGGRIPTERRVQVTQSESADS